MAETPATPTGQPSRTFRIVLVVSLAMNLLVLGMVGGRMIRGHGLAPMGMDMSLGDVSRALDPGDRRFVADRLRQTDAARPLMALRDRRAALGAFVAAVRAEPFDAAAVDAIFAEQRERASGLMAIGQQALLERLAQMGPEARAQFADRLERELRRGPGG